MKILSMCNRDAYSGNLNFVLNYNSALQKKNKKYKKIKFSLIVDIIGNSSTKLIS
jgi:hypothetical protein